jgi:phosphonate transport system substrate-binding protein
MLANKLLARATLWLFLLAMIGRGLAEPSPPGIEIAITPFLSVRTMVQNYEPMRVYLEKRLKRPVLFITAPDYKTFHERTRDRQYSYVITVANAAYLAQTESGYIPLLRPAIDTKPTLVVAKGDALSRIADLRGKAIALPERLAVVSMQAPAMLRDAGLDPERDVVLKHLPNHGAAVNHVLAGEVAAAIVSDRALAQMPAATKDAVRIVETWHKGAVPGIVYMSSAKVPRAEAERFLRAVLDFVDSAEGRALMAQLGYGTLLPMKADELKSLAPYGAALKAALTEPAEH